MQARHPLSAGADTGQLSEVHDDHGFPAAKAQRYPTCKPDGINEEQGIVLVVMPVALTGKIKIE